MVWGFIIFCGGAGPFFGWWSAAFEEENWPIATEGQLIMFLANNTLY
jgi:hypothetical protein